MLQLIWDACNTQKKKRCKTQKLGGNDHPGWFGVLLLLSLLFGSSSAAPFNEMFMSEPSGCNTITTSIDSADDKKHYLVGAKTQSNILFSGPSFSGCIPIEDAVPLVILWDVSAGWSSKKMFFNQKVSFKTALA